MTKLERIIDILRQKGYITYHFPDERDLYGQELPPDDSSSIFLDMTTLVYPR